MWIQLRVMMMIAPNSLVRQKKGVQGEGEQDAGDQRKAGQTVSSDAG